MLQELPRYLRLSMRWLFVPALAIVIWGELKPSIHGPDTGFDKILHFTAYFGLTAILTVALGRRRQAIWAALALAIFGGILEIVQGFVGRDAEWGDEIANIVGAGTGLAVGLLALSILRRVAGSGHKSGGANETVR